MRQAVAHVPQELTQLTDSVVCCVQQELSMLQLLRVVVIIPMIALVEQYQIPMWSDNVMSALRDISLLWGRLHVKCAPSTNIHSLVIALAEHAVQDLK